MFQPGSTTFQYNPIAVSTLGTNFRTYALFVNDHIRWNNHLTFNLGLRWDKNHGVDSAGNLVSDDSKLAPRVGMVWDPKGDGVWAVSASYGIYTAALSSAIADLSSAAGNPATLQWVYNGPPINGDATAPTSSLVAPPAAIQQVFNWCARDPRGFCTAVPASFSEVPGVSVRVSDNLASPSVSAYAVGVSRQIGSRGAVRADYSFRDYNDFYVSRIDLTNGTVMDEFGNRSDLAIIENTNDLERRYSGLTVSANYRLATRTNVGGSYTLSRLWGNFEGENVAAGPLPADAFQYPEYRQLSWYAPEGDLAQDQRHRSTLWINYEVPKISGLSVSLLQTWASGLPYGAGGGNPVGQIGFSASASVDARPYVTNPGYANPQGGARQNYYYTARDEFRTEASRRTDFAANYNLSYPDRLAGHRTVRAGAGAQHLQSPGPVRVRCHGVRQRRGRCAQHDWLWSLGPNRYIAARTLQPIYGDAGTRGQLELQRELRHAAEPIRVHLAADVPNELRRAVLTTRVLRGIRYFRLKAEATRYQL